MATATWTTPPTGAQRYEKYTFDGPGNRLTEDIGSGSNAYTASTSDPNQYIIAASNGSVTYESPRPSGNTKTVGALSCSYDANNRLLTASNGGNTVAFYYDPKGRCVARTVNAGSFLANYYAGWNLIEDRNGSGVTQRVYVQGAKTDETAAVLLYSGGVPSTWMGYHYDALGNVTHLTGTSGTVLERYAYNAFGTPYLVNGSTNVATAINTSSSNAVGRRLAFQGHEFIPDLALYDFRNRMHHPALGRFIQPDPAGFSGRDTNIYRFCSNDPINMSDPFGLFTAAQLAQMKQWALDGMGIRLQQIDAALRGDMAEWQRLQDVANEGRVGSTIGPLGMNAAIDYWEANAPESAATLKIFADKFPQALFNLGDSNPFSDEFPPVPAQLSTGDLRLARLWAILELHRQQDAAAWAASQTPDDNPNGPNPPFPLPDIPDADIIGYYFGGGLGGALASDGYNNPFIYGLNSVGFGGDWATIYVADPNVPGVFQAPAIPATAIIPKGTPP